MKLGKMKLAMLALVALAFVACGKNKDDGGSSVSGGTAISGNYTLGPSGLPTGQGNVSHTTGAYVTWPDANQFSQAVRDLIGADTAVVVNPSGTVNNSTGVSLYGEVSVNSSNGAVMPNNLNGGSQSRIQIVIRGSNITNSDPVSLTIANPSGGASNGSARLTFQDALGTVTIQGTYNASTFNGSVSFVNTAGNRKSGTLGNFSISTCAFFVCQ
jgi:hypothetical protein